MDCNNNNSNSDNDYTRVAAATGKDEHHQKQHDLGRTEREVKERVL